ncbi:hypothetical protein H4219_002633 [Mycoemilia scoparia]|uniref:HMA domain-containing protein n=1 Tax=Mycoemilia scoparia TaxID=417184 RepID=A0A9W8A2U3_9FUNG|nr:hypothetical protein H4219_002633 [Mycoemilia scoparia]
MSFNLTQQQITKDTKNFHFEVAMSCGGCSGAVTRALTKPDNQITKDQILVSHDSNTVLVSLPKDSKHDLESVKEIISKTGKAIVKAEEVTPEKAAEIVAANPAPAPAK